MPLSRVSIAIVLPLALVVAGCTAHGVDTTSSASAPLGDARTRDPFDGIPLVPESGVYLGAFYGDRDQQATDEDIGAEPRVHLTYFGWEDAWPLDDVLRTDADEGRIPLVNWEPFGADFAKIVRGDYDVMLASRAREASELPGEVFVDFAAEMNEGEGWGNHDPDLYIAAYRHVHDIFEGVDGGNVVWVWAPNNVDSAGAAPMLDYYPGDDYVDWTGIDGYNWGTSEPGFEWQSFREVFQDAYHDLHSLGRPIIIGETASAEEGGSKAGWIEAIVPTLEEDFPDIRAVVWFDVDKERDWRIRSSEASEDAFRLLAADPLFEASSP